jgi:membrane-anchored glycerophosphoryl diester phosphodiesterase (GDPDase)
MNREFQILIALIIALPLGIYQGQAIRKKKSPEETKKGAIKLLLVMLAICLGWLGVLLALGK